MESETLVEASTAAPVRTVLSKSDPDAVRTVVIKHAHHPGFVESVVSPFRDWWAIEFFLRQELNSAQGYTFRSLLTIAIQPIGLMAVFAGFFMLIGAPPIDGIVPFFLFVLSGLACWQFVERIYWGTANTFVARQYLLTNMAFPRMAIPVATVGAAAIEMLISLAAIWGIALAYGFPVLPRLFFLPISLAILILGGVGFGVGVAMLGVVIPSAKQVGPILIRVWFFGTPIFYSAEAILQENAWILHSINPVSALIAEIRWAIFGLGDPSVGMRIWTIFYIVAFTLMNLRFYQRHQTELGDLV